MLVFTSVGFDLLTNRSDIILSIIEKKKIAWKLYEKLRIVEDTFQIFAEGIILSTFHWCLQISKNIGDRVKKAPSRSIADTTEVFL